MKFLVLIIALWSAPLLGAGRVAQFEQKDIVGETKHYNQTEGTTAVAVPAVAGKPIAEALIRCPSGQTGIKQCLISFEAIGGPFLTLSEGEFVAWSIKGYKTQFWIKGAAASTNFEMIVNFEP